MVTEMMLVFDEFCTKIDDLGLIRREFAAYPIVVPSTTRNSSIFAPWHHQRKSASASGHAWSELARSVGSTFHAAGEVE